MVHASRTTRHLDSLSHYRLLWWAIRPYSGTASNEGRGLRLFDGRRKQFR